MASKASVLANAKIVQSAKQRISSEQSQSAGDGTVTQEQQAGAFSNQAAQQATAGQVVTDTIAGPATNSGDVEAGGDAVVSKARVEAGAKIDQKIDQYSGAEQSQTAGDGTITQGQSAGPFTNQAAQDATADPTVTSTVAGAATNSGEVEAGGDAVASKARVDAGAKIGQKIDQSSGAEQSQTAGDGSIGQEQAAGSFTNQAEQSAAAGPVVTSTLAGAATNTDTGDVDADDDAVASQASVNAGSKIGQSAKQSNSSQQSQKAKNVSVGQTQSLGSFNNEAGQSASAGAVVTETIAGAATNSGEVEAGGDAVASKARVEAGAKIDQKIDQYNGAEQSQTAGDGRHRSEPVGWFIHQFGRARRGGRFGRDRHAGGGCHQ